MRDEQSPLQWQGFRPAGLLCPGVGHCEAHAGEAMVVAESPAAVLDHGGPQGALYSAGFVWLHFVDDGEASLNEEAPGGCQWAALFCFFLLVDKLLGRLERSGRLPGRGSDLADGSSCCISPGLTVFRHLLYRSEAIRSDSHSP